MVHRDNRPRESGRYVAWSRCPALHDQRLAASIDVQERIVELLEDKLGIDSCTDVRLRLLGELSLGTCPSGVKNWIADRGLGGRRTQGDGTVSFPV